MEAIIIIGFFISAFAFIVYYCRRENRRRRSLRQDSHGDWVWVGFDGREESSPLHPDRPGGAWWKERKLSGMNSNDDWGNSGF